MDTIKDLELGQAFVWPLVHDNGKHYKFYNVMVRKINVTGHRLVCTWGKIGTRGQNREIEVDPDDATGMTMYVYDILSKKKKKGYRTPSSNDYNVITETNLSYTMPLGVVSKAPRIKKKINSRKKTDSLSKRFDDLIME